MKETARTILEDIDIFFEAATSASIPNLLLPHHWKRPNTGKHELGILKVARPGVGLSKQKLIDRLLGKVLRQRPKRLKVAR